METRFTKLYEEYLRLTRREHDTDKMDLYVIWCFKMQGLFYFKEKGIKDFKDSRFNSEMCLDYCNKYPEKFLNWLQEQE